MSTFINKKEEVLQIRLTPYGKFLLSEGKLAPHYYSFYDSDIIYETPHFDEVREGVTGVKENQNDIVTRINSTQRTGIQTNFSTLSGSDNNAERSISRATRDNYEQITPNNFTFMNPVGTGSPFTEYYPAWFIKTMTGSVGFYNASYSGSMAIPTLSASVETKYSRETVRMEGLENTITFHEIVDDQKLLIDIQELNTIFKGKGNYDIEVFKAPTQGEVGRIERVEFINQDFAHASILKEQLQPEEYSRFLNGNEDMIEEQFPTIDPTYVEYYLSVKVDGEIGDLVLKGRTLYTGMPVGGPIDPCKD
jgi:hypothetical protein